MLPLHPYGSWLATGGELHHEEADVPDLSVKQAPGTSRLLPSAQVLRAGSAALRLVLPVRRLQREELLLGILVEHLEGPAAGAEIGLESILLALAVSRCVRSSS